LPGGKPADWRLIGSGVRLHDNGSTVLFVILGAAAAAGLGCPGHRSRSLARWLPPVLAAGILAELALSVICSRSSTRP
jgi:hypothetical protein